jgi:hypothetical protein
MGDKPEHVDQSGDDRDTQDRPQRALRRVSDTCGDVALAKKPKVKKPASEKSQPSSTGVETPATEIEVRATEFHIPKAARGKAVREAAAGKYETEGNGPHLVDRDGVAYVEGCDVPVWRLEMARRVGSGPQALQAAFPGLTAAGIDLAFAYARRHRAKFDKLIRVQGASSAPAADRADDKAAFEAELETLIDKNTEVFRRLAQ